MLPFGHIAAGYLLSEGFLAVAQPAVSARGAAWLVAIGTFSSFAPDLDMFYVFAKEGGLHHTGADVSHRTLPTHAPLAWLALAAAIALGGLLGRSEFWLCAGALVALGSWSHFLLDSTDVGVRWFYPFSDRYYALKNAGAPEANPVKGFFPHWWNMLKTYAQRVPLTVALEALLVVVAAAKAIFWGL
jgi:membrane-bound metal-dependent hydrolase YbcI (DUF457 family)